ncbi:MAG TPA: hypothetical protein VM493_11180 [Vicinamibacterales bacterium]|nr:hypothetical protein [Vicinamibacterales bacterium]
MTSTAFAAAILGALSLVASAPAQEPTAPAASKKAWQHLSERRPAEALLVYEDLTGRLKTPAPDLLQALVKAFAEPLRGNEDPRVRVDACEALLTLGPDAKCVADLNAMANDGAVEIGARLAAASSLFEHSAPGARDVVNLVVAAAITASPSVAADSLARLPPAISNEPLKRLAMSENRDARYVAALALARRPTDDVVPTLRAVAADTDAGAARLVAYIGLAATGDPAGLKVVRETLPLIKGRERLEAALALTAIKDPQGAPLLQALLTGEHELQRLDAAETLYPQVPDQARPVLAEGAASTNPFVRIRAMQALARLELPSTPAIRRAMGDSNSSVAVAALDVVAGEARRASKQ